MKTKFCAYIISLIVASIKISLDLRMIDNIPVSFFIIFLSIGLLFYYTINNTKKPRIITIVFILCSIISFCYMLYNENVVNMLYSSTTLLLILITIIVSHRAYKDGFDTHQKNLIRHSKVLINIINRYCTIEQRRKIKLQRFEYQAWIIELERARYDLEKEVSACMWIMDFSCNKLSDICTLLDLTKRTIIAFLKTIFNFIKFIFSGNEVEEKSSDYSWRDVLSDEMKLAIVALETHDDFVNRLSKNQKVKVYHEAQCLLDSILKKNKDSYIDDYERLALIIPK
ncbi:hypothetical protein SELR_14110 [Selenomonas ruminantium subsp. lactilytica TAM6421]|uniref:Uncharacterized protein n=1 Tax=Selenomonas ruminantium subsp. lactilytica (strain NBRC 103574 / TAM6421) TaxID=927704 RepID=I0GQT2_SELRL|nr:hypothetical protein [Selenomonas ruminantium]BAL83119.1 hypothetical protein SELR_14110 [Selenomonas ruminantium subsp. lactilytica TAM6421]